MSSKKNVISSDGKPKKRRKTRKEKFRSYGMMAGGAIVVIGGFTWLLSLPPHGTVQYSVCKVFAERQLYYPETMRVISAEYVQDADTAEALASATDRVWEIVYTFVGPFGESRSETIRCKFGTDPDSGQMTLQTADIDRHPVDPDLLKKFNPTIPAILAANPSTVIPRRLSDDLVSLRPDDGDDEDDAD